MDNKIFCEYRFKFYLNASHSIIINGKQGQVHPHTWEITLDILVTRKDFTEFNVYEKTLTDFFAKYQNQTINDIPPFDAIIPTLETMVEYFGNEIRELIRGMGCELIRIEGSETPTRSYIISYAKTTEYFQNVEKSSKEAMSRVIDSMLDDILA